MKNTSNKHLYVLHRGFLAVGFFLVIFSLFVSWTGSGQTTDATGSVITLDKSSIKIPEKTGKYATLLRIGNIDQYSYYYEVDFIASDGCKISIDSNATYHSTGNIMSIPSGGGGYNSSKGFYAQGVDDDQVGEADSVCTVTFTVSSDDSVANGNQAVFTIYAEDDDVAPSVVVSKIAGDVLTEGPSTPTENSRQYSIGLSHQVYDPVSIVLNSTKDCKLGDISPSKGGGAIVYTSAVSFTLYSDASIISVIPVDDSDAEGAHSCILSFNISSTKSSFNNITSPSITIPITDNDSSNPSNTTATPENEEDELIVADVASKLTGSLKTFMFNGRLHTEFNGSKIKESEPLVLSGEADPLSIVKLFIYSDPITATTTADDSGKWEYTVEGLETGEHRVEVETVNSETNEVSERVVVARFSVVDDAVNSQNLLKEGIISGEFHNSKVGLLVFVASTATLAVAGFGYYWLRIRKNKTNKIDEPLVNLENLNEAEIIDKDNKKP